MRRKSASAKPFVQQNKTFHENIIKDLVNDSVKIWKVEYEREIASLKAEIQEFQVNMIYLKQPTMIYLKQMQSRKKKSKALKVNKVR